MLSAKNIAPKMGLAELVRFPDECVANICDIAVELSDALSAYVLIYGPSVALVAGQSTTAEALKSSSYPMDRVLAHAKGDPHMSWTNNRLAPNRCNHFPIKGDDGFIGMFVIAYGEKAKQLSLYQKAAMEKLANVLRLHLMQMVTLARVSRMSLNAMEMSAV